MNEHRQAMERALREILVPTLREHGFKGSLPHFRRIGAVGVDYLSVQFNTAGGSFVIEIVAAPADGKPAGYGRNLSIEKLNVAYFRNRLRLGSQPDRGLPDYWFVFGPKSYDPPRAAVSYEHFVEVAGIARDSFCAQGEAWFSNTLREEQS